MAYETLIDMGRAISVIVATATALAAFGFGVGMSTVLDSPGSMSGPSAWRLSLAVFFGVASLVLEVVALVLVLPLRKRHGFHAWRGLRRQQRRYATRQLRGKLPVHPHEVDLLRLLAHQRRDQRVMALQPGGLILLAGALASLGHGPLLGLALFVLVLAMFSLAALSWDIGQMVTFLDRHGWAGPLPSYW